LPAPVIFAVCMTVPDLPLRTARSLVEVQVPVAVVALVKCIVKVSENRLRSCRLSGERQDNGGEC
jgi:hypothetical protein